VTQGVVFVAGVVAVAFLLTVLFPPGARRWFVMVGVVFALGEWVLAFQRSADRDEAREGFALVLFSGLFALYFLALWLLGVAAGVAVSRLRARRAAL
jgi:hypothetical protein